jgi:outer membrane cobalamin receptor
LVVLDKKGRPIEKVIVRSVSNSHAGMTNRKGLFFLTDMADDDQISMILPKYGETIVPVAGMDSIVVTLRSARRYSYVSNEGPSVTIDRKNKVEPNELIDAQELLARHPYSSLIDLLRGANVPGLNITPSGMAGGEASVNIRGERSFLLSSEPLVVVDGMPVGELNAANSMVNVHDIKTIEVQKGSSEWGARGANGVILITTRKN